MAGVYQRYHSDLKLAFAAGDLPWDITRKIPRSTKQRWKESAGKHFWMPIPVCHSIADELTIRRLKEENKNLRIKLKALLYLVVLYRSIV